METKTDTYRRPKAERTPRMKFVAAIRLLVLLVVLGLVPAVLWWQTHAVAQFEFMGLVEANAENIGPTVASRIVSIDVAEGTEVRPGDVLVRFDPTEKELESVFDGMRIKEYEQTFIRRLETLQEAVHRARGQVRDAEQALADQALQRAREEGELAGLKEEADRIGKLVEKHLVSDLELSAIRPKITALERSLEAEGPYEKTLESRLASCKTDLAEAEAALAKADSKEAHADLEAMRAAGKHYMDNWTTDTSILRAVTTGTVSRVFHRAGDVVAAGEPVLRVSEGPDAVFVSALVPPAQVDAVKEGDLLQVRRFGDATGKAFPARVERVDAEVMDAFDPVSSAPRVPVRGRKIRLLVTEGGEAFVPGETVVVSVR